MFCETLSFYSDKDRVTIINVFDTRGDTILVDKAKTSSKFAHRKVAICAAKEVYDRNLTAKNMNVKIVGMKLNPNHYGWVITMERKPVTQRIA